MLSNVALRYQILLERVKTARALELAKASTKGIKLSVLWIADLQEVPLGSGYKRLQLELYKDIRATYQKAADILSAALLDISGAASEFELNTLKHAGDHMENEIGDLIEPSPHVLAKAALRTPMSATGSTAQRFMQDFVERQPRAITQFIDRGFVNGLTNQEIIQGLRGTKARNYKDGLAAMTTREAEAVARTVVQQAASSARGETWKANSDVVVAYKWVATLDNRTTTECRSLDGQVFKIDEGPMPPLHINCRSTTIAELDPDLGLGFLDKDATRASKNGSVDAKETYYSWLKHQTPAFQDTAIGPTRGQLFRDGGLSADEFARLNIDRSFNPLSLDEMRKLEPLAFEKAGL